MGKRYHPVVMVFLAITVASNIIYFHANSNTYTYAQDQLPDSTAGVKITSPAKGQKVPVGELKVTGTSTDNTTTDCHVYVDLNDLKPMQNTTAAGAGGQNDYSNWTFTYTSRYHLISEGINELTAKLSCIDNPANITKYYSVNVTGVAAAAAANNTTTSPSSNTTINKEITENNNQTKVSTGTLNQTQKATLGIEQEPKKELQPEPPTDSAPQPLKETQNQEEAQMESKIDGRKGESFTSEVIPLGESSYDSDALTEELKETIDEKKSTELIEPSGQLPDYAHDQEQIGQDEPQPVETLSQPPESPEQQPLEENQPVETLSQPPESPEQQPLETLEAPQPIEESPKQSFNHEAQPSLSEIQSLGQKPTLSEQEAPESTIYTQEQHGKSANEMEQPYSKDDSMPFVLPFDSQDVTPSN